jgi:hypothetical protein
MREKTIKLSVYIIALFLLSACGEKVTETPVQATLSNDQLGTRAAQTVYADLTLAAPVQPSYNTPVLNTPLPTNTLTPIPPTNTQGPTAILTSDIFASGQTEIRDDFESLTGWYTGSSDTFTIEFLEGGYHMVVNMVTGPDPVYSIRSVSLEDVLISLDVMRFVGGDGGYFGVVCRFADQANYYRFVLYTEGEYEIAKKDGGVFTSLARDVLSKPFLSNGSPNNISASCVGNTLALYVNDVLSVEVNDPAHQSGNIGIIAGTDFEPGLDVLFDNFIVSQP